MINKNSPVGLFLLISLSGKGEDLKATVRRHEAGSHKFSAKNYVGPSPLDLIRGRTLLTHKIWT